MNESERIIVEMVAAGVFRIDPDGSIWRVQTRTRTGRLRALPEPTRADQAKSDGYRMVRVGVNGREIRAAAHRIVWLVTRGQIPSGYDVNHDDGLRGNNRPSNLEPMTKGDNLRHSYRKLGRWRPSGERCRHGKLTLAQVVEIRSRYTAGEGVTRLAAEYGVTRQSIRRAAVGETWRDEYPEVVTHA